MLFSNCQYLYLGVHDHDKLIEVKEMSLTEMCRLLEGDDPKVLLVRLASAITAGKLSAHLTDNASRFRMMPRMWRWPC